MRAVHRLGMVAVLFAGIGIVGCSKSTPPAVLVPGQTPVTVVADPAKPVDPPAPASDGARREKYDAAVRSALNLMADQKYTEALGLLEAAQLISDTDEVRAQIERAKGLVTQKDAVEQTAANIQTVLKDGNAEEASKLASAALKQFGDSDAPRLSQLKRQADALAGAVGDDDRDARKLRFVREGDAAVNEKNLRAAAIAYEQAVQAGAPDDVRKKLDELRGQLTRYDELRGQAAELRRDPYRIEDAVAMLEDAQKSWDTLQVRQEIEDYKLALLKRRDRISVADFEVRGDVGIPLAGRAVAEELLPAFRTRFDVIERAQLTKIMDELKLEASDLIDDDEGRHEVGKLAKVRYLVLGSVSALSGVTVNARLVDVRTGLVAQTAKISGRTPEEALKLLPELAKMLTMSDEDRIAQENQLAQKAEVEVAPAQLAAIPPPPSVPQQEQPPPPPVIFNPKPPAFGNLQQQDFDRVPLPPPPGQVAPPAPVVVFEQNDPFRNRLLQVTLQLGDNLFRRGQFREANRHFELALNLAPGEVDIRLRLDRCRPLLPPPPPPPVVIVQPIFVPPPVIRPRVAILNFFVNADPRFCPPGFGDWAADQFASQFYPWYDVIDRGELYWYMGRLGLTVRDVLLNPTARFYLARALNVRYFVFGSIQQTASFDVSAQLIDAETGFRQGTAFIHVHDRQEMKWRMGELVRQLRRDPRDRDVFVRESRDHERIIIDVRRFINEGNPGQALVIGRPVLRERPYDVALRSLLEQAERRNAELELELARRRDAEARMANRAAQQRRQEELAREAELARARAEREARERDDAARRAQERQRDRAHERLLQEAREARTAKNFALATQLLQSAVALNPTDDTYRQLAQVRAQEEAAVRARAAEEKARLEDARRKEAEAEALRLRAKLEQERKAREADELARRKVQEANDLASYNQFLDDAQAQLKQEKYDSAIATLLSAKQLRATPEVNRLLGQAQERKAQADLAKKTAADRAVAEKKLAEEKAARDKSDAEAKLKQEKYSDALVAAQKAFQDKRYDEATARYQEAQQLFPSQAVLNGLGQVREAQAKERALVEAEKKKKEEQDQRAARVTKLLSEGQAALTAKQFDKALKTLADAKQLEPTNVDVLTALSKAEQARDEAAAQARLQKDQQEKQARFQKLLVDARDKLKAKQYDAAVASASEALKLKPGDPDAAGLLKAAEQGRGNDAKTQADAKLKAEDHQKLVAAGKQALAAKQYDAAAKSFQKALEVLPNDTPTQALLADAERLRKEQADLAAKQQDEAARQAEVQKLVKQARAALTAKDMAGAAKAIDAVAKLAPKDADVLSLQQDLQKLQDSQRGEVEAAKKKQAAFDKLLSTARQAQAAKRYDDALAALADADKLIPGDKEAAALRQDIAKAKSDLDAGDARKKADFQAQLAKARQAVTAKRYDDALAALSDAEKLIPGDKEAQTLRQSAEKGKADLLAANQEAEARKKKLAADFQAQVAKARLAVSAKRYDDALQSLTDAEKLIPGDKEVQALRQSAEKGKADLLAANQEAEAKKKKLAEFTTQLNRAKQALAAKRTPEALQALNEADKLNPGAPETAALRKEIEKARLDGEAEAKKKQDFTQLMNQGQQAMTTKRFEDAVKLYTSAAQLMPGDPTAKGALADAQKALAASKVPPKPKGPTPQEEYAKAMQTAAVAEKQNRFDDAIKAYQDALKAQPNDAKATAALRNAQYQDNLAEGNQALKAKKYPDAVRAFEAALKLMPNDPAATAGLKQAKAGK